MSGAASSVVSVKGQTLLVADSARLGTVYRVGPDGSAQIMIEGRLVTIPADTLSQADGKLTTSLTKTRVPALH